MSLKRLEADWIKEDLTLMYHGSSGAIKVGIFDESSPFKHQSWIRVEVNLNLKDDKRAAYEFRGWRWQA